ncbi:MAG: UDP-4-amino-4,6-dideoxy-N-acetyl-beta-L-altrosamine transaminase [Desulfobacteraceae bacterium]|nr:MAG: UDP-4-amino-4,6-dideoxy-N-acetyl-beta-L-altrosamine transaminase [Desulfobacteraceae bacterium]
MKKPIPYGRQSVIPEDIEAVIAVLQSDWLTMGPKVTEFEEAVAAQCGAKHCIAVANGTAALHLACLALKVGPGDLGVTSPISFLASANCIVYCDGRPDFVDIDPQTLCLSPDELESYCKTQAVPKVVIPVDFAGVPADLPRFRKLADHYGFKLIEDAAHSIGSTYEYKGETYACGSCAHTDLAIFSFHPVKTITTGEGGAILTNDDHLAHKLRLLSSHGIERNHSNYRLPDPSIIAGSEKPAWYHEMQMLGYNYRLTDIHSVLGLSQMKRLERHKAKRQQIVRNYNKAFAEAAKKEIFILPPWPEHTDPCYHLYPLRLGPACGVKRNDLYRQLRERNIYTQVHYIPIYRQPFHHAKWHRDPAQFPESEKYFANCFSLPLFPAMTQEMFDYVVQTLLSILK